MNNNFDNIRIVLIHTTHPGNIGAVARAMKTMCHSKLYLVKPRTFPSAEATARATGADDILVNAVICDTLDAAIEGCHLVVGTSARERYISCPVYSPRECVSRVIETIETGQVALLFGRESAGLSNDEIETCNMLLKIPANNQYSSLNVAAAVQLICYEIMMSGNVNHIIDDTGADKVPLATSEEMRLFYQHLEQCLIDLDYYDPEKPRRLMRRMKRLFNRALLDQNELNILRGIFSAAQEKTGKN